MSFNGRPVLATGFVISEAVKAEISQTISTYRQKITQRPGDQPNIIAEIVQILAIFPMQDAAQAPADIRARAYLEALGNAPAWAVAEARRKILAGETSIIRWAPTPPELKLIVDAIMQPHNIALVDLERLQEIADNPDVIDKPTTTEKVEEGLEKLRSELRENMHEAERRRHQRTKPVIQKANDIAFKRDCEKHGVDPKGGVSGSLLKGLTR